MTENRQRDYRSEFDHKWSTKDEKGYMAQVRAIAKKDAQGKLNQKKEAN